MGNEKAPSNTGGKANKSTSLTTSAASPSQFASAGLPNPLWANTKTDQFAQPDKKRVTIGNHPQPKRDK